MIVPRYARLATLKLDVWRRTLMMIAAAFAFIGAATLVRAADVNVLATTAMKSALDALAPQFTAAENHTAHIAYGSSGALAKRVTNGEAADVVVLAGRMDDLVGEGKVRPDSRVAVAAARIGVAVRRGSAKPDISSPGALRRALLAAKSIAFAGPASGGASGIYLTKMFERLGIAAEVDAKARFARGGPDGMVSALVAAGEAEIGLQQIPEMMSVGGVELVGPLPDALQTETIYAAGILIASRQPEAAKSLIAYLRTPAAAAVLRAKGLEPR